jgi:hypothetical protein
VEAAARGRLSPSERHRGAFKLIIHPQDSSATSMSVRHRSRSRNASYFAHSAFVATFEPKDIGHALFDPNWVNAMHEELENFERNQVWELVELPPNCKPIGTKWVWKTKREKMVRW